MVTIPPDSEQTSVAGIHQMSETGSPEVDVAKQESVSGFRRAAQ